VQRFPHIECVSSTKTVPLNRQENSCFALGRTKDTEPIVINDDCITLLLYFLNESAKMNKKNITKPLLEKIAVN
jgi:hypothetical protein